MTLPNSKACIGLAALLAACASGRRGGGSEPMLITAAESSGYVRTGPYEEVVQLCRDFASRYPEVSCEEIGRTLEDRPIMALRISKHRVPAAPVIYIQAGIHAGEIEGKDAGFWFFRDLLDGKVAPGALESVDIVFVPSINPDGHERRSANNRPNQRGPEEMGFRTNAARENLNRDFMKAEAPETQAMLRVLNAREPLVFVDIHTTDGMKFQHDISLNFAPLAPRPDGLDRTAQSMSDAIVARMTGMGHLPVTFYPGFVKDDDPSSGFAIGEPPPRFSHAYAAARSELGILVENHSWRTYQERVAMTYHFLQALLEQAATQAPVWQVAVEKARAADLALGGSELPLVFENTPHSKPLEFRGYVHETRPSEISGAPWIIYDETRPQIWKVPLFDELRPKIIAKVPQGGYYIEGGFAPAIAAVLDRHGISYTKVPQQGPIAVETFRASKATFSPPFEGHTLTALEGAWKAETRTLDRGALFVPIQQPNARVLVQLLDPAGPDSLAQWGELNNAFEQKEYMEAYVAEAVARELLAKNPSLRGEFDKAVAADPALAKSPEKRLDWFYQRSAAWDERTNLLPIYKTERAPQPIQ